MGNASSHVCCVCLALKGSAHIERYRQGQGELRCYDPCTLHQIEAARSGPGTYIFHMPDTWYEDTTNQILAQLCGDDVEDWSSPGHRQSDGVEGP